ncbi:Protein spire-like 1 [Acipenser ruthenus]|uniref:Protein spire-like 1 n=1 Tax=Acipenser ruthenus TaxID=7906 RepID=A0A662YTF1_ACIRT|nr:Protein spire-like 1 [Acipenser ruthenus]
MAPSLNHPDLQLSVIVLADVSTSEAHHRAGATALANGAVPAQSQLNSVGTAQRAMQRKRLLKAPTLAELDSSDSEEEFCYPVECLALTVEEVMHIRQVLVKAELEKFQQYKDVYSALKKGKLCFCCRTKRFSFFTWSYTCQFCKRPVCSQCCKKMRLPSKPYANLPIYSLGSSTLHKEESVPKPEKPSTSLHRQHSLYKTVSRFSSASKSVESSDDLELPKELTEDWSTMEVCVDCKMFISEIICSSKRSLVLATRRARLKRKTRSFYMSSSSTSDYRPSERTIKEV